jgi:hypothetical protein
LIIVYLLSSVVILVLFRVIYKAKCHHVIKLPKTINHEDILDAKILIQKLNTPQSFVAWFADAFRYDWDKFWIRSLDAFPQSAEQSIKSKKGICLDAAYLALVCLRASGHNVTGLNVYFRRRTLKGGTMHSVCLLEQSDALSMKYYVLGDTNLPKIIKGPFPNIKSAAQYISSCHSVPLGGYTTGLPSYHLCLYYFYKFLPVGEK